MHEKVGLGKSLLRQQQLVPQSAKFLFGVKHLGRKKNNRGRKTKNLNKAKEREVRQ
jgi:hypothetical protein